MGLDMYLITRSNPELAYWRKYHPLNDYMADLWSAQTGRDKKEFSGETLTLTREICKDVIKLVTPHTRPEAWHDEEEVWDQWLEDHPDYEEDEWTWMADYTLTAFSRAIQTIEDGDIVKYSSDW